MKRVFVTASGTDVGKTHVLCALIAELRARGTLPRVLKPLVTGFDAAAPEASDTGRLLAALGRPLTPAELDAVSPWRFAAPLSPDRAAAREQGHIDFAALVEACRPRDPHETTLVEGIGGVMVPIDAAHTVLDLVAALEMPALLVTGSYLGSLSHALTAAHALSARGIALAAVVVSESSDAALPLAEQRDTLARFLGGTPVVTCAHGADHCEPALLDTLAGQPSDGPG